MSVRILIGDVRERLRDIPDESVHCVVTSPPYFGLRDYGTAQWEGGDAGCDHKASNFDRGERADRGNVMERTTPFRTECGKCGARRADNQIGLEATPDAYVAEMVNVFRDVRRVLRKDGTLWLNLGDSYATGAGKVGNCPGGGVQGERWQGPATQANRMPLPGLKPKDLIGIPWRVAFALQADGWWLRQDIIWHKPNPMPESVRDRCTKAHEYLFLLTKNERYFYDIEAVREDPAPYNAAAMGRPQWSPKCGPDRVNGTKVQTIKQYDEIKGANRRSVWTIATQPFSEAHFATFPPELPELCIKAGTSERGCCPQCGAGWTRAVEREPRDGGNKYPNGPGGRNKVDASRQDQRECASSTLATVVGWNTKTVGWGPSCGCCPPIENAPACFVPRLEPATVLDPFGGAGTTGLVADRLGRNAILIELNPEYASLAERRIHGDAPLFSMVAAE